MKVYIVNYLAPEGRDPCECDILGVFASEEDAEQCMIREILRINKNQEFTGIGGGFVGIREFEVQ